MARTIQIALFSLLSGILSLSVLAQEKSDPPAKPDKAKNDSLQKKFDKNGDGKIDDNERKAIRELLKKRGSAPGAMTPSGKTETVGNRLITELEYASKDGRKIPAVLSMPKGEGPFPCVVTIHGGSGGRDLGFIRTLAAPNPQTPTVAALNDQPWAILSISYRAGNGALFASEQDDVVAGIRHAKTLPGIDPERIGVFGGSHGGHLALRAAELMGKEFRCVVAGSPWMTNPLVPMLGKADETPLSKLPESVRTAVMDQGRKLYTGVTKGRGLSDKEAREFLTAQSIEANAEKIVIPSLFLTSLGDEAVPHLLVQPTIDKLIAAGRDVSVYTAQKSPHGFYWGRESGGARIGRGEKTKDELSEEAKAREMVIGFFKSQFAKPQRGPAVTKSEGQPSPADAKPAPKPADNRDAPGGSAGKTEPVRLDSGLIVGEAGKDVHVFRGIPYAAPPVGKLRWQPPQPPAPWKGVRDAVAFGAPAIQGETFFPRKVQSEDCLSLNVWAPAKPNAEGPRPVFFWIHGGAFIQGSGAQPRFDGSELARRGVVVVTINYRLGTLGLYAHPALTAEAEANAPLGNYCLLDMMEALRWVQRNIASFGGDPKNVTISGSSAGATSCLFLMGIPAAKELFHKAIVQSSGGIKGILDLNQAEEAGGRLAERLKYDRTGGAAGLRGLDAGGLAAGPSLYRQLELPVKPFVDGRLVTHTVADSFAKGQQSRIPVILGATNGESGGRAAGDDIALGGAFGFQLDLARDMQRDGQKVYLFQFSFVPPAERATKATAAHGEGVAYSFGTYGIPLRSQFGFRDDGVAERATRGRPGARPMGKAAEGGKGDTAAAAEEGRKISEAMMAYWVSFMQTGRPQVKSLPDWPAYDPAAPEAMAFGNMGVASKKFRKAEGR